MRYLELLGTILSNGYHAEIKKRSSGSMLVLKNNSILSNSMSKIIKQEGFEFRLCYNEKNGNSVFIFLKKNDM